MRAAVTTRTDYRVHFIAVVATTPASHRPNERCITCPGRRPQLPRRNTLTHPGAQATPESAATGACCTCSPGCRCRTSTRQKNTEKQRATFHSTRDKKGGWGTTVLSPVNDGCIQSLAHENNTACCCTSTKKKEGWGSHRTVRNEKRTKNKPFTQLLNRESNPIETEPTQNKTKNVREAKPRGLTWKLRRPGIPPRSKKSVPPRRTSLADICDKSMVAHGLSMMMTPITVDRETHAPRGSSANKVQ